MQNLPYLIAMTFSEIIIVVLFIAILFSKKQKGQIQKAFMALIGFMFIWTTCLMLQILLQNTDIPPVRFECYAAFGACFAPLAYYAIGIIFEQTKVKWKWYYSLLLIIPITSIVLLFTNDYHHLFYQKYSIYIQDTVFGTYFPIHSVYTYVFLALGLFHLLRYSVRNSGFFSKQSALLVIGILIPIAVNILGLFGIPMAVYLMPISFTFTLLFFVLAIFKFKFLTITPIALQKVVDRISDSYIVLNSDNVIIDFNKTFLHTFSIEPEQIRNQNLLTILQKNNLFQFNIEVLKDTMQEVRTNPKTFKFQTSLTDKTKYFNVEISGIYTDGNFLGTIILFKDTTQHMLDMKTIKNNQDMLMEKERLASLGQLIGGIAHNLKTPIMSISGAAEGLHDLIREYDLSIGDPEVTEEDHHAIAKDMAEWVAKIKTHVAYMSDIITAVKGQAVTFAEDENNSFTVEDLVKQVNILMRHELKNALIELNVQLKVDAKTELKGNINSLVQVINNMISNAIQAYNGKPNETIDFIIEKDMDNNQIILSVSDKGCGLSYTVKEKLFKEMVTTKGKNGTGLGLFMSYSNIRAHFNGTITFESEQGKGTVFHIILPMLS